jgi:glycerol-3-phosphate dehydrogenase
MIFAIPRAGITYIGTTDTNYHDSKEQVFATHEDASYLIKAVNTTFPSANLEIKDIESSWAGLRPLIHEEGKSASELSRKDEIFESTSGLISIAGGKLTGYRKMAERVVNLVIKNHFDDRKLKPCFTDRIRLSGSLLNYEEVKQYLKTLQTRVSTRVAKYLVENYGKQADEILAITSSTQEDPELSLIKAELQFGIEHEMVSSLSDFFIRRTGLVYFDIHRVRKWTSTAATILQDRLKWSDQKRKEEIEKLEEQIRLVTQFK